MIITSNLPLEAQYVDEQVQKRETYKAFLRRINWVEEYLPNGSVLRRKMNDVPKLNDKGD